MGATALTESWDASRNSSNNHFMLGHITEWFYEDLLGIEAMEEFPGFKRVRINPSIVGDLAWAEGSYDSLHGPIRVRWERTMDAFRLEVSIPANTTAEVHLPATQASSVTVDGKSIEEVPFVQAVDGVEVGMVLNVGSGEHVFEVDAPNF